VLEKVGIKITDYYATKATRKDEESRAIRENGNTAPMTGTHYWENLESGI
jgi:hypothetical protein